MARPVVPRPERGFTLLELVVTISLLGTLVALSFPSFSAWLRNSQTRTVTEALQGGLRTAQAEALRRNRRVVMFFTDDTPSKNFDPASHKSTDAAPSATGKNWALQTAPDAWGEAEYITGGSLSDVSSSVVVTDSTSAAALCFNSNGRIVSAAAGATGTGVTGLTGTACTAGLRTFDVKQATARADDRPLRVIVQLGGQVRMCDPKRPALSATSPEGCLP